MRDSAVANYYLELLLFVLLNFHLGVFHDFEHINGKRLFEAIRNDDPEATQHAIDYAKQEFSKPVIRNSNMAEYDDM